jgi:hypothetical protein
MTAQAILMGNGYAYIDRAGNGAPRELIPLLPGTCYPVRLKASLMRLHAGGGQWKNVSYWDVFHIKGPGLDGLLRDRADEEGEGRASAPGWRRSRMRQSGSGTAPSRGR